MLEKITKLLEDILATLVALLAAVKSGGLAPSQDSVPVEEDDDLLGETKSEEPEVTQADVIEAVKSAAEKNKAKAIEVLGKFGAKRATEVKEEDYGKVIAALAKMKK